MWQGTCTAKSSWGQGGKTETERKPVRGNYENFWGKEKKSLNSTEKGEIDAAALKSEKIRGRGE